MSRSVYASQQWRSLRLAILDRDGHRCQINGPKCKQHATHVDHIIPVSAGGAPYDPANLRAACAACNVGRANQRAENWRYARTHITLVEGPPCAGKSTWVERNKKPGDLVVDYDELAGGMGATRDDTHLHGAVMAARNALLNQLRRGDLDASAAWIVSTNPNARNMFPHHELVTLDPGLDV
jgi:hypothetical protein